jgi:hypothetical protein
MSYEIADIVLIKTARNFLAEAQSSQRKAKISRVKTKI